MSSSEVRAGSWPRARSMFQRMAMSGSHSQEEVRLQKPSQDDIRTKTMRGRLVSRLSTTNPLGNEPLPANKLHRRHTKGTEAVHIETCKSPGNDSSLSATSSAASSFKWDERRRMADEGILYHGEVHTNITIWKKVKEYLVLTESGLFRYPNQSRAAMAFPDLAPSMPSHRRTNSYPSTGTAYEIQSPRPAETTGELGMPGSRIDLEDVFGIYNLYDATPSFAVALHWLDSRDRRARFYTFQLQDRDLKDTWISLILKYSRLSRVYPEIRSIWLENVELPSNQHRVFRVVRNIYRHEDLEDGNSIAQRPPPRLELLVISQNKLFFLSCDEHKICESFGLAALSSVEVFPTDDRFRLSVRLPFEQTREIECASVNSTPIAKEMAAKLKYLRPNWVTSPLKWRLPQAMRKQLSGDSSFECSKLEAFGRAVGAYCEAYHLARDRLRYEIANSGEATLVFRLLSAVGESYSPLELLAVMRSLRYSDIFVAISFTNVSLDPLNRRHDEYGTEHLDWTVLLPNRTQPLPFDFAESSLLVQEVAAIAATNRRLLRMDFANCISPTSPKQTCGILKALLPLCTREATNVEWLNLRGIHLSVEDIDDLQAIADDRKSHLHGLDLSKTNLGPREFTNILVALKAQDNTFEALDISENGVVLDECAFDSQIRALPYLRILNLSRLTLTPTILEPLITLKTLQNWLLQELSFSGTLINASTVRELRLFLRTPASKCLRTLELDGTGLTGADIGQLLESMAEDTGKPRNIHLAVGANNIETNYTPFLLALRSGWTSKSLSLSKTSFSDERRFVQLFEALAENTTIQSLDISQISMMVRRNLGDRTLRSIENMIAHNWTLTSLDISNRKSEFQREQDAASPAIASLLQGMRRNVKLQKINISGHTLFEGEAEQLYAAVLSNRNLVEVRCEDVSIPLQGFKRIVDAVRDSRSIIHVSDIEFSQQTPLDDFTSQSSPRKLEARRRSLTTTMLSTIDRKIRDSRGKIPHVKRPSLQLSSSGVPAEDSELAAWNAEQSRLAMYLERNQGLRRSEDVNDSFPGNLLINNKSNESMKQRNDSAHDSAFKGIKDLRLWW